jgi:signal transduction histidine kinase
LEFAVVLICLYCLVFVVATLTATYLFRLRHLLGYRMLIVALAAHCFIAICVLVILSIEDFETKVLFSRLRFLGLSLLSPAVLIFVNSLYRRWPWLEKKPVIAAIFLPAVVTWVCTLVPSFQNFLVRDFQPLNVAGLSVLKFRGGPWMSWHILCSYVCSVLAMAFAAHTFFKERGPKRRQMVFFGLSFVFVSAVDFFCVVLNSPWRWAMLSGGVFVFADISIIYAGLKHQLFDIVPYATERVFRNLPDPILVLGKDTTLETANESAHALFGIDREAYGKNLPGVLAEALLSQPEMRFQGRHFDVVKEPIVGSGQIVYLREFTARKKLENSLNANLDFKSKMLSLIAHDVVGNVQAQAALMRTIRPSDQQKDTVELLADSHGSLHEFLRNVLNWEKSQDRSFQVTKTTFDVSLFAKSCAESVDLLTKVRGIEIETRLDLKNGPSVTADSEMLAAILRNLLSNAVRATKDRSPVVLSIAATDTDLAVNVIDHGVGIPKEKLADIVSGEYRPSAAWRAEGGGSGGGFGVGLFISKHFIDLQGGRFWIESQENSGTRVGFSVPL